MKRTSLFVAMIFWGGTIGTPAENIRFERIKNYNLYTYPDQNYVENFLVVGDCAFYINGFCYAHQDWWGCIVRCLDLIEGNDRSLFNLDYMLPLYLQYDVNHPISVPLTGEIYLVDGIIHFPDQENCSYQCSLDPEYLGKFPDFHKPVPNNFFFQGVSIGGKPIEFPLTLGNNTYTDMYVADSYIILVGDNHYLLADREELATNGENSTAMRYFPFPNGRFADVSFIPSKFNQCYVVYKTKTLYKLARFRLTDSINDCRLDSIDIGQPLDLSEGSFNPMYVQYDKAQFIGTTCYRVEFVNSESMHYQMAQYRIVGLEGVSSIENGEWELFP